MNLKGLRVAMSVIAAALLAMMLSGCGGDDEGLSAEDMARISAAEAAAMMAQADADAAAEAQAEAEAAADGRIADLEAMLAASSSDEEIAALTQEIADLVAQIAMEPEPVPDPGYQPSDPGGTLEGSESRAAAQRIEEAMVEAPLMRELQDGEVANAPDTATGDANIEDDIAFPADAAQAGDDGVRMGIPKDVSVTDLEQARLGTPAALTLAVKGGTGLGTAADSATTDAPAIAGWQGVALEKVGSRRHHPDGSCVLRCRALRAGVWRRVPVQRNGKCCRPAGRSDRHHP